MSKFAKLEQTLQRELSNLITTLRDPRVPLVVTVEEVQVTGDGRSAEVLVSTLEDDAYDDLLEALNGASGHLQREVAASFKPALHTQTHLSARQAARFRRLVGFCCACVLPRPTRWALRTTALTWCGWKPRGSSGCALEV